MDSKAIEALELAAAAVWDSYYGEGIAVEYARKVSLEVGQSIADLREKDGELDRLRAWRLQAIECFGLHHSVLNHPKVRQLMSEHVE